MAALIHDSVEDGCKHYAKIIREKFGDSFADIFEGCTGGLRDANGVKEARQRA